ncbi:MAG: hypothetical protein JKY16_06200, partial [Lutibacter sp.]|nr:hypothetical protein [Lutibacter sp.]
MNPSSTLLSSLTPPPVCSGNTFTYPLTSSVTGTTYSWTRADIIGISEPSSSGTTNISEVLTNTTASTIPVTYIITLTTGDSCNDTVNVVVDIEPAPSAATTITGPDEVCSGSTGNVYTVTPIPNATSYEWTLPNASTVSTTSNSISINYSLTDISGNLSVHGVNSCANGIESAVLPIIVIAPPTLSSSATPADICSEQPFNYTPTSTVSGATFSWAREVIANISNPASFGIGVINESLVNTSSSPVNVIYTYTLTTPQGCENTDTVTVVVNPLPTLISTLTPAAICSGSPFSYLPASSQTGTIAWSRAAITGIDEGSNSGTGAISEVLTNTTGTTITVGYDLTLPTTGNGCSNIVTVFVNVESAPSAATVISGFDEVCAGSTDNVYTVSAIPNATSYEWTLPDASTVTTTLNSISINYSLTDSSGNLSVHGVNSCGNGSVSPVLPIIIIAPPTLSSSATPTAICSKQPFNYTPTSTVSGATFSWTREVIANISNPASFGIGAINESLVNTSSSPVNVVYTYTITTPQGCENTDTVTVVVNPSPLLTSTVTPPAICSGDTFTYTPASSTNPLTIAWTRVPVAGISGAASGTGNISDSLINTTGLPIFVTYELTLTPTGAGCTDTVNVVVQVNPLPTASISGGGDTCLNSTDNLIVFTGANGTAPYTFTYNIGGIGSYSITTTSGNSIAVPSSSSTLGTLIVYNLVGVQDASSTTCSQTVTGQSATIDVQPIPTLVITNPDPVCFPTTVDLTAAAITAGSDASLAYTYWTNATATTPYSTFTAATAGTYYVKGKNSNGCSTILPVIVTVTALPTVTVNSPTICVGQSATISATPSPPGLYDYSWTVPSGASAPGNVASFSTTIAGNYTVDITRQVAPLCVSLAATGTVTINPLPAALIAVSSASNKACQDSSASPLEITFTGASGTAPYTFTYNINGGTTQTVTTITGTSVAITPPTDTAGVFNYNLVSVTDSSSTACTQVQTGTATITINELPIVDGGVDILEVCAGEEVTLSGSGAATYTWDNGVTNGIPFTPLTDGIYTVTGTDSSGCTNTDAVQIIIKPAITGTITGDNDLEVCVDASNPAPIEITFTGANGTAPYIFSYEISSLNPTILATVSSGTGDTATIQIPTSVVDTYTVTLLGVKDSSTIPCVNTDILFPNQAFITVYDSGIIPINAIDIIQTVCEGYPINDVQFTILGSPTDTYADGLPADVVGTYNPSSKIFTISGTPTVPGIYDYTVQTIASIAGCSTSFNGTIEVTEGGKISIVDSTTANQTSCLETAIVPIVYNLEGTATDAIVTFSGNAPDGISYVVAGNAVTISGTSTEIGLFDYSIVTVSTLNSCDQSTLTGSITIDDSEITLVSGDSNPTLCLNSPLVDPIIYAITSSFGATMELSGVLPIGITFDPVTGEISGTPEESGSFTYTISASSGCGTSLSGTITVSDIPLVIGIAELPVDASIIEVCEGQEITLTGTGADTYVWDNGITDGVSFLPPQNTPTTYTVTGTNLNGCIGTASVEVIVLPLPTASITGLNVFNICINSIEPEITFTGSNGVAPYTFTYSISSQNSIDAGSPDPIIKTVISTGNSATVAVSTNVSDVYTITLISVENSNNNNVTCLNTSITEPSVATITVLESGIEPEIGTQIYQTVCENTLI